MTNRNTERIRRLEKRLRQKRGNHGPPVFVAWTPGETADEAIQRHCRDWHLATGLDVPTGWRCMILIAPPDDAIAAINAGAANPGDHDANRDSNCTADTLNHKTITRNR